jgi:lysophospholipase L1-like esterase
MLRYRAIGLGALIIGLAGCVAPTPSVTEDAVRYVALGDSYSIGTSVRAAESWPSQLVARVPRLQLVANLGVNGYASADLIADELPRLDAFEPGFVTVMIGVNDVVRGVPDAAYRANVELILEALLERLAPDRVLCVATPDYTVTPQGSAFGSPDRQRAGIERVNNILGEACGARGIRFVPEIFAISQGAAADLSLVAGDGLHPSGAQYALWVDVIAPVVEELLLPSADR